MRPLASLMLLIPLSAAAAIPPLTAIAQARRLAGAFDHGLRQQMGESASGPGPAVAGVCPTRAPAAALAGAGWRIRRVSLRALDRAHRPDAWERGILQRFEQLSASGEEIANLEIAEFVGRGTARAFRYIRAIAAQRECTGCHRQHGLGGALSLSREVGG